MIYDAIDALVGYAVGAGLIPAEETVYARNLLLDVMHEPDYVPDTPRTGSGALADILGELTDIAVERGLLADSGENRDIFDTKLMNCVMPRPAEARRVFWENYAKSPEAATEFYYKLALDSNYIRRDRLARDKRWVYPSAYGPLDITINKAKPEKDPRDIAAAGKAKEGASVRELEAMAKKANARREKKAAPPKIQYFQEVELAMGQAIGRRVKVTGNKKKGALSIEFYGEDDLKNLLSELKLQQ